MRIYKLYLFLLSISIVTYLHSQEENLFKQFQNEWPTPNQYRTASGAPGAQYWQQKVDYNIKVSIDENNNVLSGHEHIMYHNNSPDKLTYLWLQLDQNIRKKEPEVQKITKESLNRINTLEDFENLHSTFDGGFNITNVSISNKPLKYVINNTMMRIELPQSLYPNQSFEFDIEWNYKINNHRKDRGRSGYEYFPEDENKVYCIAQFYPRLCSYNDTEGWQNKQFLGRGEFALQFGDYNVEITVPEDYLVAATGKLNNSSSVLNKTQLKRIKQAQTEFEQPIIIQTLDESLKNMENKKIKNKTWKFTAVNVRDFAFAGSRRFIWDAMGVKLNNGKTVMAQSMYVKEGNCLWSKYSTKAVAHTLKWYSNYTFDYPYPTAWSIDGYMGMEYPMICFNYGRCYDDDTYTERMKYGHISVIIHEVGHNWFPMIVNSDERQWTWMDEGLNSYVQFLTEQQWERNYPSRRGPARNIVNYMDDDPEKMTPIMTNSESIKQFGNNAYGKPATALNILRETIVGRELFDYAIKEYSNRWKFKNPTPFDLFRTLEDATAVDLDWFWRTWFYTTLPVDLGIVSVKKISLEEPKLKPSPRDIQDISNIRNKTQIKKTYSEIDSTIIDFYTTYNPNAIDQLDEQKIQEEKDNLKETQKNFIENNKYFYEVEIENIGGNIMPIIIQAIYEDDTHKIYRFPAEIWRYGDKTLTKVISSQHPIVTFKLDPYLETADIDSSNNSYPPEEHNSKFEVFKRAQTSDNPMQRANKIKNQSIKP